MNTRPAIALFGAVLVAIGLTLTWLLPRATGPVNPPSPAPALRELRFGHNIPVDSALHEAAARFADQVSRRSNGRVRVQVFPAQQLGSDDQMLEMARRGELEMILTPTAKLSVAVPAMQYADLPFYFPAPEDLYAMLDGEPGQMLLEKLRAIGLVGVTFWENGFKQFTARRPLRSPEDFAGLRIRTMKSRLIMEQFQAFGATPISIDFHATRKALEDGVVDGQENPLIAIVSMGFHEVQPHLTVSNHAYLGYVFSISQKVFAELPQDLRTLLIDTARELTPWERQETHRREAALLETIRRSGVTVHLLEEEARRRFAEKTAHLPGRYEPVIGAELLSKTEELLDRRYAAGRGPRIVIGLDADLSSDAREGGLAIKRGVSLAIDEINAAGGVLGRPLLLLARDNRGIPTQGVHNIETFIANPELVAVVSGVHSPVVAAELARVNQAGLPLLAPWSSARELVENGADPNFVFRVSANDRHTGPFLLDHLLAHYRRPALLAENSLWGRGNLEVMSEGLRQRGLAFAQVESFNRAESSFDLPLARIKQSGADVIVMVAKPSEGGRILEALAADPAPLPVVSHWGILGDDFWAANREALAKVNLTFLQTFSFLDANPQGLQLAERYGRRYGVTSPRQIAAPTGVAHAYDLTHLLARAIRQAGSSERRAVRDALERLGPYDGAVKRYDPPFTPNNHDALGPAEYRLARFAKDGAIVATPSLR